MTFREKSTATLIIVLTVVFGWYAGELGAVPIADIAYEGPLLMAVVVLVVLVAAAHAAIAMAAPATPGHRDTWAPARPAPRPAGRSCRAGHRNRRRARVGHARRHDILDRTNTPRRPRPRRGRGQSRGVGRDRADAVVGAGAAAQAGLVLRNVRLVEELKASRQRLVSAQDEERRRLERDIHDGVQQRLVTLSLALRMTATRMPSEPTDALVDALDAAAGEAAEALVELRRLARGIHPAIVTEGGLAAALESLAERSPVPVEVRLSGDDRSPATAEMTVYYLVAEALTNAAKHASATGAIVDVARLDDRIAVEVSDDGVGGAVVVPGAGLRGMADRVAALGGHLEIDSPTGDGTRLWAEIPCASS